MSGHDEERVEALKLLLGELQDPTISQERLQQIEAELTDFKEQPDSWQQCVDFVKITDDPDVLWFAHSVFEFTVNARWSTVDEEHKERLREFIYMCIKDQDKSMLSHVANKIYKVYADMGKQDWPTSFSNFFDLILEMLGSDRETILVGMQLLKVVLEECVSREGVTARRAAELLSLVSAEVPAIMAALEAILQATYEGAAIEAGKRALEKRLPTNLGVPPTPRGSPTPFDHVAPLDDGAGEAEVSESDTFYQFGAEAEQRVTVAFSCLGQLFGWVNLAEVVSPDLLDILGIYARLSHSACAPAGALAVGCFIELLSSHGVPLTFEEALLKLFEHMVSLLEKVTKPKAESEKNPLDEMDPEYNSKLTDFLGLFITKHFRRVESSPRFEILDFLMLLFRFTFLQSENERFVSCIDVCLAFVDVLVVKQEQDGPDSVAAYRDCVLMLATEVIDRIRFEQNFDSLETIDDVERNDDLLTDWEEHVRDCTAVLSHISVLFPEDLIQITAPLYVGDVEAYESIGDYIQDAGNGAIELNFADDGSQQGLYMACRDLRTMTQLMGKFAHVYVEGDIVEHFSEACELVKSLVQILQFSSERKLYSLGRCFSALHAEIAGTLRTFAPWFSRSIRTLREDPTESQRLRELTEVVISSAATIFQEPSSDEDGIILEQASAELLGRFCDTVRPVFLMEIPALTALLSEAPAVTSRLQGSTRATLTVALCHSIVLPWYDVAEVDQEWAVREDKFRELFESMFSPLSDGSASDADWVIFACQSLAAVAKSVGDQPKSVQTVVAKAIMPTVPAILQLMENCDGNVMIVAAVLELELALFQSIALLLGDEFVPSSIAVFMSFFTKETVHNLANGDDVSAMVVETFFKVLQVVVRGKGQLFRSFIGDVLDLLVNSAMTLLEGGGACISIQIALFEVLRYVLLDNWKTFYPRAVQVDDKNDDGEVQNSEILGLILQVLVGSFNGADIEPFKYNLETLVMVNRQKHLFGKDFFREHIYIELLKSLLGVLVAKTHTLLEDEICDTLFELAQSDWAVFYSQALPCVLTSLDIDDGHRDELASRFEEVDDKPSFVDRVQEFCIDVAVLQHST